MTPLKIIFMGTPDFAATALRALIDSAHDVIAVYSQMPRQAGRGQKIRNSPAHALAEASRIPVFTPRSLNSADEQEAFQALGADIAVVAAYGLILPLAVLDAPRLGCVNIHASLLPRWRGAAPIQRAIMAGDNETGISIMQMDEGLDMGPVLDEAACKIAPDMTAGELHDELAGLGAGLIIAVLDRLSDGPIEARVQPEQGVTYARKIDKAECRIGWHHPAAAVHNFIRGLSPVPGAWFEVPRNGGNARVKVLKSEPSTVSGPPGTVLDDRLTVACGTGAVRLIEVQRAGKAPAPADAFLRGFALPAGTVLA
jgi:methionyl-tRNA formyltransferase